METNIKTLLEHWNKSEKTKVAPHKYQVRLPIHDAARIEALSELYPTKRPEDIIAELLGAALNELEATMPYEKGSKIVSEDEMGDPVYADEGLTPKFYELTQKHAQRLEAQVK